MDATVYDVTRFSLASKPVINSSAMIRLVRLARLGTNPCRAPLERKATLSTEEVLLLRFFPWSMMHQANLGKGTCALKSWTKLVKIIVQKPDCMSRDVVKFLNPSKVIIRRYMAAGGKIGCLAFGAGNLEAS